MNQLIAQLDTRLCRHRPDYYGSLQSGVTEEALNKLQQSLSSHLPPIFLDLYRWRNGQAANCSANLIDNWMFCSLEDVVSTKEMLDGMIGFDFEDPRWWGRGWVPFLSNGGGDYLCIDLTAEFGGTPGQLIAFFHDWEKRPVKFADMQTWLQTLVASLPTA